MTQQGSLFAPKQQPSGEGKYVVAIKDGQRFWSISRDHRFATAEAAQAWLQTQRHLWVGELGVKLVSELDVRSKAEDTTTTKDCGRRSGVSAP